ncbi:MAG: HEAT repeat domain-containing protein [Nitrospirota bacterium]|nr:HEAT repeat domain-containing protein [Nitrospirota bacterium]
MSDMVAENIAALQDEDWGIREDAAIALGCAPDSRAVRPLIRALRDSDQAVRTAATSALEHIGEPAVMELGACLRDPELSVQEAAASVLSTIADERVLDPLISALLSPDWVVRMHAVKAVNRLRDGKAASTLVLLLQDKVPAVRDEAVSALKNLGHASLPPLLEAIKDSDWRVRLRATEALGELGLPGAIPDLLHLLVHDPDTAIRQDSARALGKIGDEQVVDALIQASDEDRLRSCVIEALGGIGDRRALGFLLSCVKNLDPKDYEGRVPVCEGDRYEQQLGPVEEAIRSLARLNAPEAIPVLINALQSTLVRKEAALALTAFGDRAIPQLVSRLREETDDNIRFHVKEALSSLGWNPNRVRL